MNTFNAAALLNTDLTTITGYFAFLDVKEDADKTTNRKSQNYTWLCTQNLASLLSPGDLVIAEARGEFKIVIVDEIHSETEINLDANFNYSFAIQKVRTAEFHRLMNQTATNAKQLDRQHTNNLRTQVAAQFGANGLTFDTKESDV